MLLVKQEVLAVQVVVLLDHHQQDYNQEQLLDLLSGSTGGVGESISPTKWNMEIQEELDLQAVQVLHMDMHGGGGGGADLSGVPATTSGSDGDGGNGLGYSISGTLTYYAGGGGGRRKTSRLSIFDWEEDLVVLGVEEQEDCKAEVLAHLLDMGLQERASAGGGGGGAGNGVVAQDGSSGGSGIVIIAYPS
jgi:hypothetical protein